MAIYRQIHIDFWQDEFVVELSAEDKYFFLYLMTNNKTTQSGVYRINRRIMAFDLGWDLSQVDKLIERFVGYGRISYNAEFSEIMVNNWLKYNKATSPKVAKVLDRELKEIKTDSFKLEVIRQCKAYKYPIDTLWIQYLYSMDTETQPEPEPEPTKEPEQQPTDNQKEKQKSLSVVIQKFESLIGIFPMGLAEQLEDALNEFGEELIVRSFEIAAEVGKRNWKYVTGIHRNWRNNGIDSIQKLDAFELERQSEKDVKNSGTHQDADYIERFNQGIEW